MLWLEILWAKIMSSSDNRAEERSKTCVQAFAADLEDSFDIKCIIRDVSKGGCMIVSSQLHELPDLIQLIPEGFSNPLSGKVVWRRDKMAGISFLAEDSGEILDRLNKYYMEAFLKSDDDEPILLECLARPLGYSDRLAKYSPRAK